MLKLNKPAGRILIRLLSSTAIAFFDSVVLLRQDFSESVNLIKLLSDNMLGISLLFFYL
mgnify:CR=1 FL=1